MARTCLKFDATSADASLEKDLATDYTDSWITFEVWISKATRTDLVVTGSTAPYILRTLDNVDADSGYIYLSPSLWGSGNNSPAQGPTPASGRWQKIEYHIDSTTPQEDIYLDGIKIVDAGSGTGGSGVRKAFLGWFSGITNSTSIVYVRGFRIGSTRGANDIFNGYLLSSWGTTTGTVTEVDQSTLTNNQVVLLHRDPSDVSLETASLGSLSEIYVGVRLRTPQAFLTAQALASADFIRLLDSGDATQFTALIASGVTWQIPEASLGATAINVDGLWLWVEIHYNVSTTIELTVTPADGTDFGLYNMNSSTAVSSTIDKAVLGLLNVLGGGDGGGVYIDELCIGSAPAKGDILYDDFSGDLSAYTLVETPTIMDDPYPVPDSGLTSISGFPVDDTLAAITTAITKLV